VEYIERSETVLARKRGLNFVPWENGLREAL
jgi:hypothetical protein